VTDYILEIVCDEAREEEVLARLFLTRSTGSSSTDAAGTLAISAYFDSPDDRNAAAAALAGEGPEGEVTMTAVDRPRVDWLAQYRQSLEPLFIGRSFVVAPDAALIPPGARPHALVIPQEQAFGTGSHETTSLCIEMLESPDLAVRLRGGRGLDVGAGSGILALAMIRLGADRVIAFDNDVDACAALRANRLRNGVAAARMPLFIGSVEALRGGAFDVVTMNIIPEVILPLLPEVVPRIAGELLLGGILTGRRDEVVRACAGHGLALAEEREKGEWWVGRFRCA
jgi:ribosomal protein L11 methyltransferase